MVEDLTTVDSAFHSLYEKSDDGFRLSVDGLDDASGLKKALQSERESNKEAKAKLTELEKLRDEAERKAMEENGRYKELSEKERTDKIQAQSKYDELQRKVAEKTRDLMLRELAGSLTTDPLEQEIISRFAVDHVKIEGEEVTYSEDLESLKAKLSKFVRSKANDADDKGNKNGNGNSKTITRDKFDSLSQYERAEFAKSGGKVVE